MSNITLLEKAEEKVQQRLRKAVLGYLEELFHATFKGSMPTPKECNHFSRQSLAYEFNNSHTDLMELCREHYEKAEYVERIEMLVDLLMPVAYYKTYASKHLKWMQLQRYYAGIRMFNGMDYLFLENYYHEEELMKDMKCYPISEENFEEVTEERMLDLCQLCNTHDYFLINSDVLDKVIVEVLIKELEKGKIPQERLHGMYPATMFLEPVPDESEYVFYID